MLANFLADEQVTRDVILKKGADNTMSGICSQRFKEIGKKKGKL